MPFFRALCSHCSHIDPGMNTDCLVSESKQIDLSLGDRLRPSFDRMCSRNWKIELLDSEILRTSKAAGNATTASANCEDAYVSRLV